MGLSDFQKLQRLLLKPAVCDPTSRVRKQLSDLIQALPTSEVEHLIDQALDACSDEERRLVCMRLATLNSSVGVVPLVHQLQGQESVRIRIAAAFSLMETGDLRAVDALVQALSDPSVQVVELACNALGRIVAFQIRDKLVALLSHPEAIVRLSAARNLLEIGMKHESVLPTLEELISDPDIALIDTAIDMMAEGGKKLAELVDDARKL